MRVSSCAGKLASSVTSEPTAKDEPTTRTSLCGPRYRCPGFSNSVIDRAESEFCAVLGTDNMDMRIEMPSKQPIVIRDTRHRIADGLGEPEILHMKNRNTERDTGRHLGNEQADDHGDGRGPKLTSFSFTPFSPTPPIDRY